MNLVAYDTIYPKINKRGTWVDIYKKLLLSREMKFRRYATISKRYNKETNTFDYFVILLDEQPQDRDYVKTNFDDYGRIKISLKSIWGESNLQYIEHNCNIEIEHVEQAEDGDIYLLSL